MPILSFQKLTKKVWKIEKTEIKHKIDEKHKYAFTTVIYVKKYKDSNTKRPTDISQHIFDF